MSREASDKSVGRLEIRTMGSRNGRNLSPHTIQTRLVSAPALVPTHKRLGTYSHSHSWYGLYSILIVPVFLRFKYTNWIIFKNNISNKNLFFDRFHKS